MLFYSVTTEGKTRFTKTSEAAFALISKQKDWFICSIYRGDVCLCGHSLGVFDDKNNSCILAQLKRHFRKKEIRA